MDSSKTLKLLALEKRTGYEITQTNGQRKFGPPPNWVGPPPPKGSEIFVGKIPRIVYEDELVPVFQKVGTIYEMRLMMDFSGTNRGYGFVRYSCPREAEKAVKELNNYEIRKGMFIGVVKSVDNCRLFIGGLPKEKTKDEIFHELSKHVDDVKEVILYKGIVDKSKSRGFAFVEFQSHKAAAMARRKLIPNRLLLWGHTLQIDWAQPEPEIDEETMSKVTIIFIRNLLLSTSEESVKKAMEKVADRGSIERVKKLKDFAFVHFKDRENAKKCLEYWDGKMLESTIIEVKWAKPSPGQYFQDKRRLVQGYQRHHNVHANWHVGNPYIAVPNQCIMSQLPEVFTFMDTCFVTGVVTLSAGTGRSYFPGMLCQSQNTCPVKVKLPQFSGDQTQFQPQKLSLLPHDAKTYRPDNTIYHLNHSQPNVYTDGFEHGRMMPFTASGYAGVPPQPEVAITYALAPNQSPGYMPVVQGKVQGMFQLPI